MYKPPHIHLNKNTWSNLLNSIHSLDPSNSYILCGDLNANHKLWGSEIENKTRRTLIQAINCTDFIIINNKISTLIPKVSNKSTAPDISMIASNLGKLTHWSILEDPLDSDHFPISIQFNLTPLLTPSNKPKITLNNMNWTNFVLDLNLELPRNITYLNYITEYDNLINTIIATAITNGAKIKNIKYSPYNDNSEDHRILNQTTQDAHQQYSATYNNNNNKNNNTPRINIKW